jgi:hypothetical protein
VNIGLEVDLRRPGGSFIEDKQLGITEQAEDIELLLSSSASSSGLTCLIFSFIRPIIAWVGLPDNTGLAAFSSMAIFVPDVIHHLAAWPEIW